MPHSDRQLRGLGDSFATSVRSGGTTKVSFPGLDVLRGWSAVGVVVLHACAAYTDRPMPGLAWSTADGASRLVTVLMWSIEVVIMPIFLVMAGFLAARSMARGGRWHTVRSRMRRLGVPFVLAAVLVLPLSLYAWLLGWAADGLIDVVKLRSLKLRGDLDQHLWGTGHLWFLQYLMTYIVLLAALERSLSLDIFALPSRRQMTTYWWLAATAVVAVAVLLFQPEVVWGFQHSFWPVMTKWAYSGAFFFAGVLVWKTDPHLLTAALNGPRQLAWGGLCLAAAVALGIWHLDQGVASVSPSGQQFGEARLFQSAGLPRWTLAILTVAAAWTVTTGLLGSCQRWIRRPNRLTARLAESSLWIYLLHHPLVGLTQVSLKHTAWQMPIAVKLMSVVLIGVSVPLLIHQVWLGRGRQFAWRSSTNADSAGLSPDRSIVLPQADRMEEPFRRAG